MKTITFLLLLFSTLLLPSARAAEEASRLSLGGVTSVVLARNAAIKEALDDMANGDAGMPFDDFDREFRRRHQLPAKP